MSQHTTRADYLRGADEAERLGNFALAGTLKTLALTVRETDTRDETADLDTLKAQIAEAESMHDFATAGRLKSELLEAQRAPRK